MIIRLHECPPQPWKNGLGSTREIAAQPSDDGSGGFLWRASIAEVDSAAPFSVFPGIDRTIVLLAGNGFTLTLDGTGEHPLTTPFVPFAFPGETQVTVTLAGGATRDFNLMVQRRRARGEVLVWRQPGAEQLARDTVLVFCARGMIETADGTLAAGDAWRPAATAEGSIVLADQALALVARVEAHAT